MKKVCHDYVGAACVNGTCPKTIKEEYEEYRRSAMRCSQCFFKRDVRTVLWQIQNIVQLKMRRKADEILQYATADYTRQLSEVTI